MHVSATFNLRDGNGSIAHCVQVGSARYALYTYFINDVDAIWVNFDIAAVGMIFQDFETDSG